MERVTGIEPSYPPRVSQKEYAKNGLNKPIMVEMPGVEPGSSGGKDKRLL